MTPYYMYDMYDVIINTKQGCIRGGGVLLSYKLVSQHIH